MKRRTRVGVALGFGGIAAFVAPFAARGASDTPPGAVAVTTIVVEADEPEVAALVAPPAWLTRPLSGLIAALPSRAQTIAGGLTLTAWDRLPITVRVELHHPEHAGQWFAALGR